MIRASVCYESGEGTTFDLDYYVNTHMPLVHEHMSGVVRTEVDKGMDGPYVAVGHLYFESAEAMQAAMGGAGPVMADVPNFTNITPVMQVSEVVDG